MISRWARLVVTCAILGCSPVLQPALPSTRSGALHDPLATGAGKIKHIVYIVQENRSFDDLFQGYPGADTVSRGRDSKGGSIALVPVSLKTSYALAHSAHAMFVDCNGTGKLRGTECRMNGFNQEFSFGGPPSIAHPMYAYVPHDESQPYFAMAQEWVLADKMFASQLDESFVAHQYIIAAQAHSSVDLPSGKWGCGGGARDLVATMTQTRRYGPKQKPCFNYETLGDELDEAKLPWRFYTSRYSAPSSDGGSIWSGYQAVEHIYRGPDWHNIVAPQKEFITDVADGKLAAFTWITPLCINSDHPSCGGGYGPSWVTALVDAVGESKFWKSTVIFVQWDDWGGLYDHVPPPHENYDSLGFRVPLLVISAYAKKNYVSHVHYETASVLRFAEDLFGLRQLSEADRRAASPAGDCFDFAGRPRKFGLIKAPEGSAFFLRQPRDYRAPDTE